jgi:hypothetical protein
MGVTAVGRALLVEMVGVLLPLLLLLLLLLVLVLVLVMLRARDSALVSACPANQDPSSSCSSSSNNSGARRVFKRKQLNPDET